MIVVGSPPLSPDAAARRAAAGAEPVWVSSPGRSSDTTIALDLVACDPVEVVRSGGLAELERAWTRARRRWSTGAPGAIPEAIGGASAGRGAPPIAVGWLAYELARTWMMPRPGGAHRASSGPPTGAPGDGAAASAGDGWPAALEFRFFDAVWLRDRATAEAWVLATTAAAASQLLARLSDGPGDASAALGTGAGEAGAPRLGSWSGAEDRARHRAAVLRIQEYLRAGDVYQVNLTRRLVAAVGSDDPLWMASELRAWAPAPHAIWLGGRSTPGGPLDRLVVGNSPERFLRVEPDGAVETRPIKGTRARGFRAPRAPGGDILGAAAPELDPELDEAARQALLASAKDRAEHVMIVDLERNDLGRVARVGSVICRDVARAVAFPRVHHLVSTVRARLRPDVGLEELLRATFPGGSITGAPKRRAMEIIDELEATPRGIYTGATGWLGAAGNLDLAVAIRTAVVDRGSVSLGVGGGIVLDSVPDDEWKETELKARAFLELGRR